MARHPLCDHVLARGPRHRSGVEQVRELRGFACHGCDQHVVVQECLDLDFEAILMALEAGRGLV